MKTWLALLAFKQSFFFHIYFHQNIKYKLVHFQLPLKFFILFFHQPLNNFHKFIKGIIFYFSILAPSIQSLEFLELVIFCDPRFLPFISLSSFLLWGSKTSYKLSTYSSYSSWSSSLSSISYAIGGSSSSKSFFLTNLLLDLEVSWLTCISCVFALKTSSPIFWELDLVVLFTIWTKTSMSLLNPWKFPSKSYSKFW